jgi:hypothetical protein
VQFPAEYDEGRVPLFSPISLSFLFVSVPFRLPITPTLKPYRWLHSGAPERAPIVPFLVPPRVASPKWLNASRLGRIARTGGTATLWTLQHQSCTLMRTAAAWCINVYEWHLIGATNTAESSHPRLPEACQSLPCPYRYG